MYHTLILVAHKVYKKAQEKKTEKAQKDEDMSRNHTLVTVIEANNRRPESVVSDGAAPPPRPRTRWQSLTRLMSSLFSFLAMCCFAAAVGYTNANYVNTSGGGDWTDGFALVSPIIAILVNPLMVLRNFFKSRRTHTPLRVALDLIIFALGVPAVVYAIGGGIFWYWQDAVPGSDGQTVDCGAFYNAFSPDCAPVAYTIGHLQVAGAVFLIIVILCHAGLVVSGLLEIASSRRASEQRRLTRSFEMETAANKAYDIERGDSRDGGSN